MAKGLTEELASRYYRQRGYFVECDVQFKQPRGERRKVGGWSDIDILAFNGKEVVLAQCKSSLGTGAYETVSRKLITWFQDAESFLRGVECPYRAIMMKHSITKVLVTFGYPPKKGREYPKMVNNLKAAGIEILYGELVDDIIGHESDKMKRLGEESPGAGGKELDTVLDLLRHLLYTGKLKARTIAVTQ